MKFNINILTYNTLLPLKPPVKNYGQEERITKIPTVIEKIQHDSQQQIDIIVFNEVIPLIYEQQVKEMLVSMGYKYCTCALQAPFTVNGGVFIFSKYKIIKQQTVSFGDDCLHSDCFSAKGVSYASIMFPHIGPVHIFATHMQAWPGVQTQVVRDQQIKHIYNFVKSFNIPVKQPVFLAGDLNLDLYINRDQVNHLLYKLHMKIPNIHEDSHMYTIDPKENILVGADSPTSYFNEEYPNGCVDEYYKTLECVCCDSEWIDYVLFSKDHLQPIKHYLKSFNVKVVPFPMKFGPFKEIMSKDVSDHFPVLGHFEYDSSKTSTKKKNKINTGETEIIISNKGYITMIILSIIIGIIFVLTIIVMIVYYGFKRKNKRKNKKKK